ncbi:MAG: phosphatidate cytidylyltransferase [Candidatus Omnitrophica bacterium]|nr:phosphatidate cytidylyltransferase [Candidatus Omnitrophota bacterium]
MNPPQPNPPSVGSEPHAPPPSAPPPPPAKRWVFLRRLLSSIVLWAILISALFSRNLIVANYFFLAAMMALAGVGLWEFYRLVERSGLVCFRVWGILFGLLLMASTFFYLSGDWAKSPGKANDFETSLLILFVLGLCVLQFMSSRTKLGIVAISTTLFGLMYVPWLLNFIQKIAFFPHVNGRYYVLYFVLVTKFSDTGAYVVGSIFGKHKMIPRISPGKTWEGFVGAILTATIASVLFAGGAASHLSGMDWRHAVILGALLGATAVVGDLVESQFKRQAGVKDSGRIFPGMGGMLDLLDSLLFNAPLMYLYLRHVLT